MTMRVDFTSQTFFRDPAAGIERLRASGPVLETRFPIVGKVWITTTYESTARGFVEAMHGTITAANRTDRSGAIFAIRLPISPASAQLDTAA